MKKYYILICIVISAVSSYAQNDSIKKKNRFQHGFNISSTYYQSEGLYEILNKIEYSLVKGKSTFQIGFIPNINTSDNFKNSHYPAGLDLTYKFTPFLNNKILKPYIFFNITLNPQRVVNKTS